MFGSNVLEVGVGIALLFLFVSLICTSFQEGWRKAASAIGNKQIQDAVRSAFELGGGDLDAARANLETWYNGTMDRVSGWYKRRAQRSLFLVGLLIATGLNIDAITIVRELSVNADLRKAALIVAKKTVALRARSDADDAPADVDAAAPAPAEDGRGDGDRLARVNADYEMARRAIEDIGYPVGWRPAPQLKACEAGAGVARAPGDATGGAWRYGTCSRTDAVGLLLLAIPGWLATALAVMLGAPFWFDVLNKFMVIRSTVKSYEKSSPEGSEDRRPAQPAGAAPRARGMP